MGELSEVAPAAKVEHFDLREGAEIEVTTATRATRPMDTPDRPGPTYPAPRPRARVPSPRG